MERYNIQQRVEIVKAFYQSGSSISITVRQLNAKFGKNKCPSKPTIYSLVNAFETFGSVADRPKSGRPRSARMFENIVKTHESVDVNESTSIRHRAQELNLSRSSLSRIMHDDLHLKAYKITLVQQLKESDHQCRRNYCNWLLNRSVGDPDFWQKIIMTDEAHFHLSESVINRQNCRIWATEQPCVLKEEPLHSPKVTVWCGIWTKGVIGPYFFEDAAGKTVTVNGERFRHMIETFLKLYLVDFNVENIYFQQDGATSHTSKKTIALLQEIFPSRLISRFGDVDWPPRSPDLTAPDYFLWGYLKDKVYANHPRTITQLKHSISAQIAMISTDLCENVMQHAIKRAESCKAARGGHLNDIIFKF